MTDKTKTTLKNRKYLKGEELPYSKLTLENVNYIRNNYVPYSKTNNSKILADKFNVDKSTISLIINNKIWV